MVNSFWNGIDWLGRNFSATLTVLSFAGLLFGPLGWLVSGVAALVLILYEINSRRARESVVL